MNKIDEASNEFEYSSGWKKMIKDNSRDRINEEFRAKIEDLQIKLEELNSSIKSLANKDIQVEKISSENISTQHMLMQKIIEYDSIISGMDGKIKNIQNELIQYKNLTENQSSMLSNIMDILKSSDTMGTIVQKGFLANIFKKK